MLTGIDESTRRGRNVVVNGDGAVRVTGYGGRYADLGQIISASEVAVGASVFSTNIDGIQWARWIVVLGQSTGNWEFGIIRRDSSGTSGVIEPWATSQTANSPSWKAFTYSPTPASGPSGVLGYSARFYIRNIAAMISDVGLKVQLIGG